MLKRKGNGDLCIGVQPAFPELVRDRNGSEGHRCDRVIGGLPVPAGDLQNEQDREDRPKKAKIVLHTRIVSVGLAPIFNGRIKLEIKRMSSSTRPKYGNHPEAFLIIFVFEDKSSIGMKRKMRITCAVLAFALSYGVAGQSAPELPADSARKTRPALLEPYHRNTIKFNPTPMLLLSEVRNITLSYERLIKPDQSIAVQAGYLLFPRLMDDTIAGLIKLTSRSKQGVNLAVDYRWYPYSRNRRPAPDGLYVGAYASYYGFKFQNNFDILNMTADDNGAIDGKLNFVNIGASLGYQFIFWKRMSVDLLLFGPSLSLTSHNVNFSGNLDSSQIDEIDDEIVEKIDSWFPLLGSLISGETTTVSGRNTKLGVGFRYSISIGYHF